MNTKTITAALSRTRVNPNYISSLLAMLTERGHDLEHLLDKRIITVGVVDNQIVFGSQHAKKVTVVNLTGKAGDDINWHVLYGLWFGYPTCCIEHASSGGMASSINSAITNPNVSLLSKMVSTDKLAGTGFSPCPECNSKHTTVEMIKLIETARVSPSRFYDHEAISVNECIGCAVHFLQVGMLAIEDAVNYKFGLIPMDAAEESTSKEQD